MAKDAMTAALDRVERRVADVTVPTGCWLSFLRRYLMLIAGANLLWEVGQLPLYTIWADGTPDEIAFAVLHCTGGDILIAGVAILAGLPLFGDSGWPIERFGATAGTPVVIGGDFTIFSKWQNVEVIGSWAYSKWMPTLPVIGTGLSPLAQWIVIPIAAFWWSRRSVLREVRNA